MPSGIYQSKNRKGGVKGKSGVYLRTEEHKKKISETLKRLGIKPPSTLGKKLSISTRKKISLAKKEKPTWLKGLTGEKHPSWIKDRTKLAKKQERNDPAYREWRKNVWVRDKYKCKIGNLDCTGKIQAHHILPWRDFPELRYEVNNGITLCQFHHPRRRNEEKRLIPVFQGLVPVSIK